MLQFIVLGIVPGTSIQLTLNDIVLMIVATMFMYILVDQAIEAAMKRTVKRVVLGRLITR